MEFRTVVVAALILSVASVAGLAAYTIADEARGEASQAEIERSDSLAVEPDIRQALVSDDDHHPTRYADSITVTYNDTEWVEGEDYEYYPEDGEIEFLRDEDDPADVDYSYFVPEDQVADEQLQTLTEAYGHIGIVAAGLSLVAVFVFVGVVVARRMNPGRRRRGR